MGSLPPDKLAIGRALLAGGPITQEQLQRELEGSQKAGTVLGKALLQSGFPTDEEVVYPLLARLRIPKINARKTTIPLETIRLVPEEVARRHRILPLDQIGQILVVVMPDVGQEAALAEVRRVTGLFVTPIQCTPEGFDELVDDLRAGRIPESEVPPHGVLARVRQQIPDDRRAGAVLPTDTRPPAWFPAEEGAGA